MTSQKLNKDCKQVNIITKQGKIYVYSQIIFTNNNWGYDWYDHSAWTL